jgi:hypothetical protein
MPVSTTRDDTRSEQPYRQARGKTTLMVWTPPDGIDVPRWWC